MYGADDFLPMLTYVVAQCDMPQLDTEIQYMMELLDPSLLQGEGGFLLFAWLQVTNTDQMFTGNRFRFMVELTEGFIGLGIVKCASFVTEKGSINSID